MAFGVLFTAGCTDFAQQVPPTVGGIPSAERSHHLATANRAARVWMRVARQAMENGHPDTAIRFAKMAVLAAPESEGPMRLLAQAYSLQIGGEAVSVARDSAKLTAAALTGSQRTRNVSRPSAIEEELNSIQPPPGARNTPNPIAISSVARSARKPYSLKRGTKPHVGDTAKIEKTENTAAVSFAKRLPSPQPAGPTDRGSRAYRIQLAAYVDHDDAVRGRNILTRRLPNNFPRLGIFTRHRPTANDKRVNYRLRSRDLTNRSQAKTFCKAAKAAGFPCLSIRQTGSTWQLVKTDTASQAARPAGPAPQIEDPTAEKAGNPVRKADAITTSGSPVNPALSRPAADTSGRLFRIQLAAYRDLVKAVHGKKILSKSLPGNFPRLEILKRNGNAANRSRINYWVRSQDLWHKSRARALCDEARSAGHACLLIEPKSTTWRPMAANQ